MEQEREYEEELHTALHIISHNLLFLVLITTFDLSHTNNSASMYAHLCDTHTISVFCLHFLLLKDIKLLFYHLLFAIMIVIKVFSFLDF